MGVIIAIALQRSLEERKGETTDEEFLRHRAPQCTSSADLGRAQNPEGAPKRGLTRMLLHNEPTKRIRRLKYIRLPHAHGTDRPGCARVASRYPLQRRRRERM